MHRLNRQVQLAHAFLVATLFLWAPTSVAASPDDLQQRLDEKRGKLDRAQQEEGVQSVRLQELGGAVDDLTGEVAALRNREASVEAELKDVQARLAGARSDLEIARERLLRSKRALRAQLVSIYKTADTDALTVLLDSNGYDDLLGRATYLGSVQDAGERITQQVSDLRDQKLSAVETIGVARDQIASRQSELQRTRQQLEARQQDLLVARRQQRSALAGTRTHIGSLQGDVNDLERKIRSQIQVAQDAAATTGAVAAPGAEASSSGLIWPVEGAVTSPFGPRWGTIHAGIDIGAAEGTPIHAAQSGKVILVQSEAESGGYGNYTCIDHGGGLSTCYAHQLSIGVTLGQDVAQGAVIGEVGNTGHSFGAHLHFETRVNGVPEDPLGYL